MKPLVRRVIKFIRELEKEPETVEPKEIWVRAWQAMVEWNLKYDKNYLIMEE